MSGICELCQSSANLEKEEGLLICTTCGLVVDEDDFQNDFEGDLRESKDVHSEYNVCNLNRLTSFMKAELRNPNFRTDSRRQARNMLDFCFDHFKFTKCMKEDARYNFIQLLNSKTFYFCSLKVKIILAGVTVYLTMNKFDCVVTKYAISKSIGCTVYEFGDVYKKALNCTKVEKPKFFKMEQQVSSAIHGLAFEKSELPELMNIVIELIRFQERCCSIDSRSVLNVIYATTFHAWKSIRPNERSDVKLSAFQKQFNLKANLSRHSTKLLKFLIDLCETVPWILNKKKLKKTIYFQIKHLLEDSVSILDSYMKIKNKKIDDQNREQASHDQNREHASHELVQVKRERPEFDDDDCISDSEIESYIRSNEEVRILKRIKMKYGI